MKMNVNVNVKVLTQDGMWPDTVQASCDLSKQKQALLSLAAPEVGKVRLRAVVDRDVAMAYLHVAPQGTKARMFVRELKLGKTKNGVGLTELLLDHQRRAAAKGLASAGSKVVNQMLELVNVDSELTACLTAAWDKWAEIKHDFQNNGTRLQAKRRHAMAKLADQVTMLGADLRRAAKAGDDETVKNAMALLTERMVDLKHTWTHTPRW